MITVITITYNNYQELIKTCDGLKGIEGIEHLIINGGQCEKTKSFLDSYSGRSISEPDKGISDAFNKGVFNSTSKYFCVINSGDILVDKKYFKFANEKIISESPDIIHCHNLIDHPSYGRIELKPRFKLPLMPFCHQAFIMKKTDFEAIGCFNLDFKIAMDYDLMARLLTYKRNLKDIYYPHVVVEMDGHGISSKSEYNGLMERIKSLKSLKLKSLQKLSLITLANAVLIKYKLKKLLFN